jgi:hypothetical protein
MSEHNPKEARTEGGSVTNVLPDERREGEGMTEFTMRRLRNEVIEKCARAAEKAWPRAHTYASENADVYRGQDRAVRTVVKVIRGLKQ